MLVEPCKFECLEPLSLASGRELPGFTLAYETYGQLTPARDNAILVCHALSANAHAAGRHRPDDARPGWWDAAIGPGRMLDTDRYFVVCSNALGGNAGSSGPSSSDPHTGRPYGLRFPVVSVADMVAAQIHLADHLSVARWHAVVGGCLGGAQALTWLQHHPDRVGRVVAVGITAATSAHTIAFFEVMRQAVRLDPRWRGGDYYGHEPPDGGLGLSVMLGMLFWMTPAMMTEKFGRALVGDDYRYTLESEFRIERQLAALAEGGVRHLDANTMLYLTRAYEYFDLARGYPNLREALREAVAPTLLVSYTTDWRYAPERVEELAQALPRARHLTLDSPFGHGAYLIDPVPLAIPVRDFLEEV